jgi:hypothetical protein
MSSMNQQYSALTIHTTKQLSKAEKKKFGIFITPKIIIDKLLHSTIEYAHSTGLVIKKILEPSCGTCEIINSCDTLFQDVEIQGVEYNEKVFDVIKELSFKNNVRLTKMDFMKYNTTGEEQFDLSVGNPPYFVCSKSDVSTKYQPFCSGRPNIFGLFIIHTLSMLSQNGILSFVVPKSFLNSLYYAPIRNHIKKTCVILNIIDFTQDNEFIDTDQATFGLIIQKLDSPLPESTDCAFSLNINNNFMFASDSAQLNGLFEGSTTLEKMGFKVRTGTIVWNEHKDELSDDADDTLLIYNSNISNENTLEIKTFKNIEKGQYIKKAGKIDPTLVVNRGNGNSAYKLNYAIIREAPYLIENHLNEIYFPKKVEKTVLLEMYNKIIDSFQNPKTQHFIELFLGNNGLSKTELETIFPIY